MAKREARCGQAAPGLHPDGTDLAQSDGPRTRMASQLTDSELDRRRTHAFAAIWSDNGHFRTPAEESGRGSCSVLAALIAAALLLLAALVLQKPWRTYSNETLGFSVRYPLLWRAEVHRIVQIHTISFIPWFGLAPEGRRLEIQVIGEVDDSQWTSEDYLSFLQEPALADPHVTIYAARRCTVDSRPGAQMAVEMEGPEPVGRTALWVTVCGNQSYRFMLGTIEVGGKAEDLEDLHAQFVDSFRFLEGE